MDLLTDAAPSPWEGRMPAVIGGMEDGGGCEGALRHWAKGEFAPALEVASGLPRDRRGALTRLRIETESHRRSPTAASGLELYRRARQEAEVLGDEDPWVLVAEALSLPALPPAAASVVRGRVCRMLEHERSWPRDAEALVRLAEALPLVLIVRRVPDTVRLSLLERALSLMPSSSDALRLRVATLAESPVRRCGVLADAVARLARSSAIDAAEAHLAMLDGASAANDERRLDLAVATDDVAALDALAAAAAREPWGRRAGALASVRRGERARALELTSDAAGETWRTPLMVAALAPSGGEELDSLLPSFDEACRAAPPHDVAIAARSLLRIGQVTAARSALASALGAAPGADVLRRAFAAALRTTPESGGRAVRLAASAATVITAAAPPGSRSAGPASGSLIEGRVTGYTGWEC